jgi:hypothetical protein
LGNFLLLFCSIYCTFLLLAPLLLLQCWCFSVLAFWWSQWVLTYFFHRSWVVWLIVIQFFLNYHFIFKFWDSVFCLFESAWVAFNFVMYLCFILFSEVFHIMGHFLFNVVSFQP